MGTNIGRTAKTVQPKSRSFTDCRIQEPESDELSVEKHGLSLFDFWVRSHPAETQMMKGPKQDLVVSLVCEIFDSSKLIFDYVTLYFLDTGTILKTFEELHNAQSVNFSFQSSLHWNSRLL